MAKFGWKTNITTLLEPFFRDYVYTVRRGFLKGLKRKGGFGFISQILPMSKEEQFLSSLNLTGKTVYDVGGFIGLMTLFFAKSVNNGFVITFEPNPLNFQKIQENLRLNNLKNVRLFHIGVGREKGEGIFYFGERKLAKGSFSSSIQEGIIKDSTAKKIKVPIDSIDNKIQLENLPKPDFVKIDVEGYEQEVLAGMNETIRQHKPSVYIEIHGASKKEKLANANGVTRFLEINHYKLYHVESEKPVNSANMDVALRGHLFGYPKMRAQLIQQPETEIQ